jgi:hypothetical protein
MHVCSIGSVDAHHQKKRAKRGTSAQDVDMILGDDEGDVEQSRVELPFNELQAYNAFEETADDAGASNVCTPSAETICLW